MQAAQFFEDLDCKRLVLAPGDIILVSCDSQITRETAERLKAHVEAELPGHKVLILSDGLKIAVLTREMVEALA